MLIKADTVVIGAGLFGSIIAKNLREKGKDVLVLDCEKKRAASRVAGCLIKPVKYTNTFTQKNHREAIDLLDKLYTLKRVCFKGEKQDKASLYVSPESVLTLHDYTVLVKEIMPQRLEKGYRLLCDDIDGDEHVFKASTVIVCAGVWSNRLVPLYETTTYAGLALLYKDCVEKPRMELFNHNYYVKTVNRGDGVWVSAEEMLLVRNWNPKRKQQAIDDYSRVSGTLHKDPEILFGYCSIVRHEKPCFITEIRPNLWVATGGYNNSTILAAHAANIIARKET